MLLKPRKKYKRKAAVALSVLTAMTGTTFVPPAEICLMPAAAEGTAGGATFTNPLALPTEEHSTERHLVEDVIVEGNRLVSTEDILGVIKTRRGDPFDREQVMHDLKAVNNLGYFDDSLQVVPEKSDSGVLLKIRVVENAPITQFAFEGNTVLSAEELNKLFAGQLGKPQNLTQLSAAIDKVEQQYHERGYTLARVTDVKDDPDGSVSIKVDEGVINDVKIVGNKKTKDFIIRNALKLKPGSVYNEKQLTNDLRKLYANGYFQDIRRSLTPSADASDKYTLKVEVDEKRTGSIGLGGGVDTVAGPFGQFSFSDSNFRGRGQVLSFSSNVGSGLSSRISNNLNNGGAGFLPNARNYQVEATFIEPSLRGTNTSLAATLSARNFGSMLIDSAQQRTIGGNITFSKPLKGRFTASLGLAGDNTMLKSYLSTQGMEYLTQRALDMNQASTMAQAQQVAQNIRDTQLKGGTYLTINPSLFRDTRDNPFDPTRGSFMKLTAGPSLGLTGNSFLKAGASVSKYVPVSKTVTLAMNVQGGSGLGGVPQFAQYRLGGWNGIRGYRTFSDLGSGTGMLMGSLELRSRLPLPKSAPGTKQNAFVRALDKNVKAVAFFDAGAVSGNSLVNNFYQRGTMGTSVGVGLRLQVPMLGLVRLDYGYPIVSTAMGRLIPRFTIGFGDKF
jgi:outer membrane protein insertion porin family